MKQRMIFITLMILFVAGHVFGQGFGIGGDEPEREPIVINGVFSHEPLPAGETVQMAIVFDVPEKQHMTNTVFEVTPPEHELITFGEPRYPKPTAYEENELGERAPIYRGRVLVFVEMTLASEYPVGVDTLWVEVGYQICTEGERSVCYLPEYEDIPLAMTVVEAGTPSEEVNADIFSQPQVTETNEETPMAASEETEIESEGGGLAGWLERALKEGSPIVFLIVFLGGVLTSLTPCVYPMIPITISYIGGATGGDSSKLKGFILSLFFTLGIALTYSILGVAAALAGNVFGAALQNAYVVGVISFVFVLMGFSMLGAFDIALPASLQTRMQSGGSKFGGVIGAIIMGGITGIVASPCVGPVLVVLLTWVAQVRNVLMGFSLLFTFAVGIGVLFIIIGTFTGAILPSAGEWMDKVKKGFGVIFFAMAIFYLKPIIPDWTFAALVGIFFIMVGTFIGAFHRLSEEESTGEKLAKSFGIIFLVIGIFYFLLGLAEINGVSLQASAATSAAEQHTQKVEWIMDEEMGIQQAGASKMPVMIDFYADWCVACVELDERTYVDEEVIVESKRFVNIKVDNTKNTPEGKALQEKYKVKGLPTVIFLDSQGNEVERFFGFKPPKGILEIMRDVE